MASPENTAPAEEEEKPELVYLPAGSREPAPFPNDVLEPGASYGICEVCDTLRPGGCIKTTMVSAEGKVRGAHRFIKRCSDYEPCAETAAQMPVFEMYNPKT